MPGALPSPARTLPALVTACLAVAGCADDGPHVGTTQRASRPPTTLHVNNGAEPEFLDPGRARDSGSLTLDFQMFEGLTSLHPDDAHPTQGVAERWERSADGRVLRFHLRPGARWSDGRRVTAGDFVYAWKRVLTPATGASMAPALYPVLNAEPFNLGRLKAARRALTMRAQPRDDAPPSGTLPAATVIHVAAAGRAPRGWVEVEQHARLPTYGAGARVEAPAPRGFVRDADLVDDDGAVGVRAVDEGTLEVELAQATPYFIDVTSLPTLAPLRRDVIEPFERRGEGDRWTRPEAIVTNGPYTLESWRFRYAVTMKQNPFYWNRDKLKVHRIVWLEVESPFSAMSLYRSGELDMFGSNVSIPAPYLPQLEHKRDFLRFPTLGTYWYELNVRRPPLDDARVRRALGLAVDRRLLTGTLVKGAIPAPRFVPGGIGFGYAAAAASDLAAEGAEAAGFDPARARALLREAGYEVTLADGEYRAPGFPPIELLYNQGGGGHADLAAAIQDMWRRHLGVRLVLRAEEWKVMLGDMHDGRFQVARYGWVADYNHPHTFLETFLSTSPQNRTGWASPAFDEALRVAAATVDPVESMRGYVRAERLAVEGMAKIPLYFFTDTSLVKPYVMGYHGNPRNILLAQYVWIDPSAGEHAGSPPAYEPLELSPPGTLVTPP